MEITSQELRQKIDNGEKLIVDFHASWCGPCKMLKPIYEKVAQIKSFSNGKEVATKVGLLQEGQLHEMAKGLING